MASEGGPKVRGLRPVSGNGGRTAGRKPCREETPNGATSTANGFPLTKRGGMGWGGEGLGVPRCSSSLLELGKREGGRRSSLKKEPTSLGKS